MESLIRCIISESMPMFLGEICKELRESNCTVYLLNDTDCFGRLCYPNFVVARDDRISDVYFLGFDDEEADIDSLLKESDLYDDSSDGRKRDRLFFKISSLH